MTLTFDLWPLKSIDLFCHHEKKCAQFDENMLNSWISIMFTRLFPNMSIMTLSSKLNMVQSLFIVNMYCKTLIFRVTLFSRAYDFGFIHETLFSRLFFSCTIILTWEILAWTLFSRVTGLANLRENKVLANKKCFTVCQFWWRFTNWLSLHCVDKVISIYVHCDLDLWPLTKSIGLIIIIYYSHIS